MIFVFVCILWSLSVSCVAHRVPVVPNMYACQAGLGYVSLGYIQECVQHERTCDPICKDHLGLDVNSPTFPGSILHARYRLRFPCVRACVWQRWKVYLSLDIFRRLYNLFMFAGGNKFAADSGRRMKAKETAERPSGCDVFRCTFRRLPSCLFGLL